MDQRNLNGKGLMVFTSQEQRSISPSPQPLQQQYHQQQQVSMLSSHIHHQQQQQHQQQIHYSAGPGSAMSGNMGREASASGMAADAGDESPYVQEQDDDSGEGEISQFGRAKKPKRKAAPRTSRACLACRRQKMRCEGAENPPCRRCISNEVDCMFERRSDYLLNPEDRAWQNGVEKRLEHLSRTIDMLLAHLAGQAVPAPPNTAGPSFQDMPAPAPYYDSYERHAMPPNTAPPGTGDMGNPNLGMMSGGGRINYVVPSPAETAAIAAQARARRTRGNTLPNLPSASFPPDGAGLQLFSPRHGELENATPNPFTWGAATPGVPPSAHPQHAQHPHQQQHPGEQVAHNAHPLHTAGGAQSQYAHTPSNAYSFEAYPGGPGEGGPSGSSGPGSRGHGSFSIENEGTYHGAVEGGDPRDQHHYQQQQHHQQQHQHDQHPPQSSAGISPAQNQGADLVPRSLSSPNVRFPHHQSMARDDMHTPGVGALPLHSTEGAA